MSQDKLKFQTRESIYPAVEFTVEDVDYKSHKFTHKLKIILESLEEKIDVANPDWESLSKWMVAVFGIKEEVLEQLEVDEVEDIYMRVKVELLRRQKSRMDKNLSAINDEVQGVKTITEKAQDIQKMTGDIEKNVKRPGGKT